MSNYHKKRLMSATAMSALALGAFLYNPQVTQAEEGTVERIQGSDRYETATLISSEVYETSETVIIANAMEFADALAGVPLAYEKEAPILLAYGSKLRATTRAEIERLGAIEAIILGGEAAISQSIEQELEALGLSVKRISGDNRFETSALIADELEKTSPSNKAVVVDGMEFADAMSIAPFAAQEGMPIYLTKTHGLSNAEELDDYSETYIVGGETAVSETVESALNSVTRLAGLDRYETNLEVLNYFGVEASELFVSTGLNFADALTGSVLAAQNNSAVALVKGDVHSKLIDQFENSPFTRFTILGGEAAVSNNVVKTLNGYLNGTGNSVDEPIEEDEIDNSDAFAFDLMTLNTEMLSLINAERANVGVDSLSYDATLAEGTATRAEELLSEDSLTVNGVGHIRPDGTRFNTAFEYLGDGEEAMLGENIAQNWIDIEGMEQVDAGTTTIEKVLAKQFYNQYYISPGHYQNMIHDQYTGFATDIRINEHGKLFNVQILSLDRDNLYTDEDGNIYY